MNNSFSTMVELGKEVEKYEQSVKCFTIYEAFLNDLLECSVCLEHLDSSSKVLPCQHTFCKRCLHEIINSRKDLRCPECRMLVDAKIEELPCNILLVRLLEGIKNVWPKNAEDSVEISPRSAKSSSSSQQQTPHPQLPQPMGNLPRTPSATDFRMVPKQLNPVKNGEKKISSLSPAHKNYCTDDSVPSTYIKMHISKLSNCQSVTRKRLLDHQNVQASIRSDRHRAKTPGRTNNNQISDKIAVDPKIQSKSLRDVMEPLTTERLMPTCHVLRHIIFSILDDRSVCMEHLKEYEDRKYVHSVCFISSNGEKILLYTPKVKTLPLNKPSFPENEHRVTCFKFDDLPKAHWIKYKRASKFVCVIKARTPKIILYGKHAKCSMMENYPDPDFNVHFYDGCIITEKTNKVSFTNKNGKIQHLTSGFSLDADMQFKWDIYISMKNRCNRAEVNINDDEESYLPAICGRKQPHLSTLDVDQKKAKSLCPSTMNKALNEFNYVKSKELCSCLDLSCAQPVHKRSDGTSNPYVREKLYVNNIYQIKDSGHTSDKEKGIGQVHEETRYSVVRERCLRQQLND